MRCCVLLFAVVVLVVTVARADSYVLNNSILVDSAVFNGDVINLRYVAYTSEAQPSHVFSSSQVVGLGLTVQGLPRAFIGRTKAVNITLFDTYVTDATININGYMPQLLTMSITNVIATMRNARLLFALSALHLQNKATLTIQGVTAVWDTQMGDAYVAELTTIKEDKFSLLNQASGLYFLQVAMRNAAGVINIKRGYGVQISYDSVFGIDYVSCRGGVAAVVSLLQPMTVYGSSVFRITNVAADALPLLTADVRMTISSRSLFLLSSSNTSGSLVNIPGKFIVQGYSVVTYKNLQGLRSGATQLLPPLTPYSTEVFGRECVINGVKLPTARNYVINNLNVRTLVTPDGFRSDTQKCAYEQCVPGHITNSLVPLSECACPCNSGYQAPFCTLPTDPIIAFTAGGGTGAICSVPNCASCPYQPYACARCAAGYTLSNDGYCLKQSSQLPQTSAQNPPGPQSVLPDICYSRCTQCSAA